ncbi:hypothetical protein BRC64_01095 [Halobacteriales archaeon QH_10_67_22]|nr:MAG: hypothetical protein BRC64_01095 [Halobacteriales archaeon QH_10_67_22]
MGKGRVRVGLRVERERRRVPVFLDVHLEGQAVEVIGNSHGTRLDSDQYDSFLCLQPAEYGPFE